MPSRAAVERARAQSTPTDDDDEGVDWSKVCKDCNYWQVIAKKNPKHRKFPLATLACLTACLVVYFNVEEHGIWYCGDISYCGDGGPWYAPLGAMFSHINENHLSTNMVMLVVLGWFFEFTEGHACFLCVAIGGALTGSILHGIQKPRSRVRGFSGADYAIMWAQVSILLLNWKEMPLRWLRLLVCIGMLGADIAMYYSTREQGGMSFESHLYGAIGGVCVAFCFGHNILWRRWEVSLVWIGFGGYVALCVIGFLGQQYAAAALASILILPLLVRAVLITRRICVLRDVDGDGKTEDWATEVDGALGRDDEVKA